MKNIKKKILIAATSEKSSNGAAKCLLELVAGLEKRGYNIIVTIPNHGTMEEELKRNKIKYKMFRERQCWTIKGNITPYVLAKRVANIATIYEIKKFLKQNKIDLVHINAITAYTVGLAAIELKIPCVWHIREFLEDDLNIHFSWPAWSHRVLNKANIMVAISNPIKEKWQKELHNKIVVINDGLPIDNYRVTTKDLAPNTLNIILYGRISRGKGQLFYVKGIQKILRKVTRPVKFYLAGTVQDADYFAEIVEFMNTNNLNNFLQYLGEINDIKSLLKNMNISCVCSKKEGFGRVTVESLLGKCIVVGANTGATREIISNGKNGFLYEEGNLNDFVEKLLNVINNYENYTAILGSAQDDASERYSLKTDLDKIEEIYTKLL